MHTLLLLAGVVVSSTGFLDSLLFDYRGNCTTNQFVCRNSKCISDSKRCNNINDCVDGSDEEDCDLFLCKEPKYFRCKNSRCISQSFICDAENDCDDYSDEINCESFKISLHSNTSCEKGHWQCSDKLCIPNEWVCNSEPDCLDGSDETIGCSANIECDGFKCNNGHCIPHEWVCDEHDDCHDNSDEHDCENHIPPSKCTWDAQKFLCSNNKTCIDLSMVCDGKLQCPDKSDESALCAVPSLSCANHGCSHECVQLPSGPKCLCPKGYHNIDEKHCKDINECDIYGICDQKCRNTPGSFECHCEHKYILQDDKRTCKVVGGEAMMVFSSKTEIRAYMLASEMYFPIAKHLKQVVGVAYDGNHVYWTDILAEHESIVRSKEDGTQRELLVTSGLGLPEDLAIDWITDNIYFTDAEKQHIGVCSNEGLHCTVLINKDIRKPRAIVLNVEEGDMYWSDWGKPSEIAYASMDGSNDKSFVSTDIHWPNGLSLDYPNQRLYWTDARAMTLESIRLDGTDRRIVLEGVVKHPYAIAVFENRLYWSDWATHSIQSCDKFTGKNHTTIVKENREYIYGLSIFHTALHKRTDNPCALAFCSDICLLNGLSYTCACPQDKELGSDKHTCKEIGKKQMLILGGKNLLVHIEHQILGKHDITALPSLVKNVGALAYNTINNTLYVSDLDVRKIISLNMNDGSSKPLNIHGLKKVIAMDFDYLGNNLYWCDEEKATLEVLNLHTMAQKTLLHDMNGEYPESIALIPDEGVMFVALRRKDLRQSHIDRFYMDGTGRFHAMEHGLHGPLSLYFDEGLYRVFWTDAGTGNIESTSVDGDDRHGFRSLSTSPIGITGLKSDIFWVNEKSRRVYWAEKNATHFYNKKITLDMPSDIDHLHIITITPHQVNPNPCQNNNGNCSHLCLLSHKSTVCSCPVGMSLDTNNQTCIHRATCDSSEYLCGSSNVCILKSLTCNGHKDCPLGEDEDDCKTPQHCPLGYFQCTDGECIKEYQHCDHHFDCRDKSDEHSCDLKANKDKCPPQHFKCGDGQCIADRFICDGFVDCNDEADEQNCAVNICESTQFRCLSGACIPKSWECDHEYDCSDLSDEHPECEFTKCPSSMFTCTNGKCIDKKLRCDQADDCGDSSDESDCSTRSDSLCGFEEFACTSNTSICVHNSARCNGNSDCPHHEDEKDCSDCNVDEFNCDNKRCIPTQWLCDGTNDCGDNSDEAKTLCQTSQSSGSTSSSNNVCENGFRCKTGTCIDLSAVCNGKQDCYDGSDESGICNSSCQATHNPCSQECLPTPLGPVCKCRPGYQLMGDGHSCADEDECKMDPPTCSQLCINSEGSFKCDCFNGFLLRADRKSCKAEGVPLSMIFTSDNQIRELVQQTNSLHILYSEDSPKITGMDVSFNNDFLYFSIENSATIHRINKKTQMREYIKHIGQPQKISLDWSTNNVYYVNAESNSKSISVCNIDEKVCAKLLDIDMHRHVSAIVVDSLNKVMFYSLTSWWVFNSPSYVIYKTNLDGTGGQEMVKSSLGYVTGLAVDFNKKHLYYVDQHHGEINRLSYSGTGNTKLFSNLTRPVGLAFYESYLYFMMNGGYMSKCKLFGSRFCETFKLHSYASDLFSLAQQSLQPPLPNLCKNHTCSYLCIPSDDRFKCLCEDGSLVLNTEKCENKKRESLSDGRTILFHSIQLQDGQKPKNTGSVITAILVPLCLVVIGITLYCVARRRNSGKLNISMRFYNPTYGHQPNDDLDKPILEPGQREYTNPLHFNDEPTNVPATENQNILQKFNPLLHV